MAMSASNIETHDSPRSDSRDTDTFITIDDLDAFGSAIGTPRSTRPTSREIEDHNSPEEQLGMNDRIEEHSQEHQSLLSASETCPKCRPTRRRPLSQVCCGEYSGCGAAQTIISIVGIILMILFVVISRLLRTRTRKRRIVSAKRYRNGRHTIHGDGKSVLKTW
jgi:hypothetical protein